MTWLLLLVGCGSQPEDATPPEHPPAVARTYDDARDDLEAQRRRLVGELARRPEAEVLSEARTVVVRALVDELIPAWHGTPWNFHGTSTTPGEGTIACGYYVSTLLDHAGFEVERVRLAQQASENIIKTFTQRGDIHRFSGRPASEVVARVEALGEGIYVLGLDYHAALLVYDGEQVQMCHASYLGRGSALCEPALTSPAMVSDYRVIGKLLDDAMLRRWLRGEPFPTVR